MNRRMDELGITEPPNILITPKQSKALKKLERKNRRILKKFKNRKGEINWDLLDYIMGECGFQMNLYRFSYDWRKNEQNIE